MVTGSLMEGQKSLGINVGEIVLLYLWCIAERTN